MDFNLDVEPLDRALTPQFYGLVPDESGAHAPIVVQWRWLHCIVYRPIALSRCMHAAGASRPSRLPVLSSCASSGSSSRASVCPTPICEYSLFVAMPAESCCVWLLPSVFVCLLLCLLHGMCGMLHVGSMRGRLHHFFQLLVFEAGGGGLVAHVGLQASMRCRSCSEIKRYLHSCEAMPCGGGLLPCNDAVGWRAGTLRRRGQDIGRCGRRLADEQCRRARKWLGRRECRRRRRRSLCRRSRRYIV